VSSQKITHRFRHIEQVDIDRALGAEPAVASPVEPLVESSVEPSVEPLPAAPVLAVVPGGG
jgi:hypothetical protein